MFRLSFIFASTNLQEKAELLRFSLAFFNMAAELSTPISFIFAEASRVFTNFKMSVPVEQPRSYIEVDGLANWVHQCTVRSWHSWYMGTLRCNMSSKTRATESLNLKGSAVLGFWNNVSRLEIRFSPKSENLSRTSERGDFNYLLKSGAWNIVALDRTGFRF